MINFLKQLLDFLYSKKCYICKKNCDDAVVCQQCYENILQMEMNHNFSVEIKNGISLYFAGYYAQNLQKLIRGLKYHNQKELAVWLAKFMCEYWQQFEISGENFTLVPVPLHKKRMDKRHFNHMELVAEEFAKLCGYEVNTKLVKRIKNTKPQYGLKYYERLANMKNAFSVEKKFYNGEKLLILDDIYTTGSTVFEIANSLKKEKIMDITVLTITSHLSRK